MQKARETLAADYWLLITVYDLYGYTLYGMERLLTLFKRLHQLGCQCRMECSGTGSSGMPRNPTQLIHFLNNTSIRFAIGGTLHNSVKLVHLFFH
jgi:hypothetical protein